MASKTPSLIGGALATFVVVAAAAYFFKHERAVTYADDVPDYRQMAREEISDELIDPSSALFTHLVVGKNPGPGGGAAVCGYVNGKNRFGGYTGAKRFVWWEMTNQSLIESDENGPLIDSAWQQDGCI